MIMYTTALDLSARDRLNGMLRDAGCWTANTINSEVSFRADGLAVLTNLPEEAWGRIVTKPGRLPHVQIDGQESEVRSFEDDGTLWLHIQDDDDDRFRGVVPVPANAQWPVGDGPANPAECPLLAEDEWAVVVHEHEARRLIAGQHGRYDWQADLEERQARTR